MLAMFATFFALVQRDMAVFWPSWKGRFVNGVIWGALVVAIFEYIMPSSGLKNHGFFIAAGSIASWGFFEVMENVAKFVGDLEGQRSITYYLTLPLPQWLVFGRLAVTNALQAMSISILFLPIFKILLGSAFSFTHFSLPKFIIIVLLVHLFFGVFSLYLSAQMESLDKMSNVWMRIVFPLWWLGCYQFSWQTLYTFSPRIAQLNLLNPLVYVMEGMRAAIMGQEGFLPFWYCVGALICFSGILGWIGLNHLKRRLDCL